MTPPVLLTAPTPLDTDPLHADCAKRNAALPPFGVILGHPGPPPTTITLDLDLDPISPADTEREAHVHVRQWTGAPIRAIVPLPRRMRVLPQHPAPAAGDAARCTHMPVLLHHNAAVRPPPYLARATRVWDDADSDASETEAEDRDGDRDADAEEDEDIEGRNARYCSYETITAAEGLSAWSFEELRVECYAQSLVARGTKPPPVVQPALAIPPAFVPRIVLRS